MAFISEAVCVHWYSSPRSPRSIKGVNLHPGAEAKHRRITHDFSPLLLSAPNHDQVLMAPPSKYFRIHPTTSHQLYPSPQDSQEPPCVLLPPLWPLQSWLQRDIYKTQGQPPPLPAQDPPLSPVACRPTSWLPPAPGLLSVLEPAQTDAGPPLLLPLDLICLQHQQGSEAHHLCLPYTLSSC